MFGIQLFIVDWTRNIARKTKASKVYDGQKFAKVRHTAARGLDTEKVGHGFENMHEVCQME